MIDYILSDNEIECRSVDSFSPNIQCKSADVPNKPRKQTAEFKGPHAGHVGSKFISNWDEKRPSIVPEANREETEEDDNEEGNSADPNGN